MASGKRSKRRRREAQVVGAGGDGLPRRASPKVLLATAAAVVVLTAIGVGFGIASSGSSRSSSGVSKYGSLVNALPGAADVSRLFKGIPQDGDRLGSPSAPVTIVEYVDLQCPYCRDFETEALPDLLSRFVRTGELEIQVHSIAFIGPDSESGRTAAIAAGRQNRMFDVMEILYFNQGTENTGWLDQHMVRSAAASIPGLDVPELLEARDSSVVAGQEKILDADAKAADVNSTPTILVGQTGRRLRLVRLSSPTDEAAIVAAIRAVLRLGR